MKFQRANLRGAWLPCILLLLCQCSGSRSTEADYLITGFPALDSLVANSPVMVYDLNGEPDHVITITDEHVWFADNDTVANITGLSRMDSLIIVVDSGYNRVHALRETGEAVWSYGRTGKGPGEFEMVNWVSGRSVPTFYDAEHMRYTLCPSSMLNCETLSSRYRPPAMTTMARHFINDSLFVYETGTQYIGYSIVNIVKNDILREMDFMMPVANEYDQTAYNKAYISAGNFSDGSFVMGYAGMPYAFWYNSDFERIGLIHFKYDEDRNDFPLKLSPRKSPTDIVYFNYPIMGILNDHLFVIQRDWKLHIMDIRTPGKPVAILKLQYPDPDKRYSVANIVMLNEYLYVFAYRSGIIHRFNMKGILPGG